MRRIVWHYNGSCAGCCCISRYKALEVSGKCSASRAAFNHRPNQEAFEHVDFLQFSCLKIVPEELSGVKWKGQANKQSAFEGEEELEPGPG